MRQRMPRRRTRLRRHPVPFRFAALLLLAALALLAAPLPFSDGRALRAQETPPVRIGILAHRGWSAEQSGWQPLAAYLDAALPDRPVRLVPVTLGSAAPLIEAGGLEFLVTNPGHFLTLSDHYPMSVIATRARRLSDGSYSTEYGSVLFTRSDRSGPTDLSALSGARVAAVAPQAFGGFQMAWAAARDQGIDLFIAPDALTFAGFPQDRIVEAVLAGETDIGIVRSGLIETMVAEGRIAAGQLRALNANATYTYADAVSTRLYPEWPFVALSGTDPALRDAVALALLQSRAAPSGLIDLWGAPVSYHAARDLVSAYGAAQADGGSAAPAAGQTALPLGVWAAMAVSLGGILAIGGVFWALSRARLPVTHPSEPTAPGDGGDGGDAITLTRRERQVLVLIGKGLSTKEIAKDLGISPKTVEFHRTNLLRKFDARSAAQLVAAAGDLARAPDA